MTKINLHVCIIDDEEIVRVSLADDLSDHGCTVNSFESGREALHFIQSNPVDVVITDLRMPETDGLEVLNFIQTRIPSIKVIIMTGFASIETAVEAMKKGAFDYVSKPFDLDEILILLKRIVELNNLEKSNLQYQEYFSQKYPFSAFIGEGEASRKLMEMVKIVAGSDSTALITGETGTGKELLANIIHYNSNRRQKPMVKVSCAILAKDIFESELFGHVKGAFTGANKDKKGRFELAENGTIYLDDIDDIPLDLQVKLLRILQERELERVGDAKPQKIDVRIIASTKYDLKELVAKGKFREDLYYRLNVFPIHIPPLRERRDEIDILVREYLNRLSPERNISITEEALSKLRAYDWPGNVRELRNIVERLILLSGGREIDTGLIPAELLNIVHHEESPDKKMALDKKMAFFERTEIEKALQQADFVQSRAAEILQIPLSTLRSKMKKYDL